MQSIDVAHCLHCYRVTFNAESAICGGCGGELYPISKKIPAGKAVRLQELVSWDVVIPAKDYAPPPPGRIPGRLLDWDGWEHMTEWTLRLVNSGENRIMVIKCLRDNFPNFDLRLAADLMRTAPCDIHHGLSHDRALEVQRALQYVGATAEIAPQDRISNTNDTLPNPEAQGRT